MNAKKILFSFSVFVAFVCAAYLCGYFVGIRYTRPGISEADRQRIEQLFERERENTKRERDRIVRERGELNRERERFDRERSINRSERDSLFRLDGILERSIKTLREVEKNGTSRN